jgi:mRNA interferase MazF
LVIKKGEIWWAYLPEPSESEPGYKRPVLVVQSDQFNKSKISTVIAVVITSNVALAHAPGNVMLPSKQTKLKKDSVANISQIITIDKSFLSKKIGTLSHSLFQQVQSGIRLILELSDNS